MCSDAKIAKTETITIAALVTVPADRTIPSTADRVFPDVIGDARRLASRAWASAGCG